MYKAVGSRGSRVNPVLWMLEELGQPYQFVEIKLRSPEAYALNPSGKVPILIDGEALLWNKLRTAALSSRSSWR